MALGYYRRDGTAYPAGEEGHLQWAHDFSDFKLKQVKRTTLKNGRFVSTVWLGLDHNYGDGPPLIFETMVFPGAGNMDELDMRRYSTEEQALAGHEEICEKWRKLEVSD